MYPDLVLSFYRFDRRVHHNETHGVWSSDSHWPAQLCYSSRETRAIAVWMHGWGVRSVGHSSSLWIFGALVEIILRIEDIQTFCNGSFCVIWWFCSTKRFKRTKKLRKVEAKLKLKILVFCFNYCLHVQLEHKSEHI